MWYCADDDTEKWAIWEAIGRDLLGGVVYAVRQVYFFLEGVYMPRVIRLCLHFAWRWDAFEKKKIQANVFSILKKSLSVLGNVEKRKQI